jgi:hypothetical protein
MKRGKDMLSRKTVARVAAALIILVGAASAPAGAMDLSANSTALDQLNNLAEQARATGGSGADVANPFTPGSAPLTKFSASGRLNESLASGGCSNDPLITSSCSGGGCSALTMTGTVNATSLGNSTLNICFTLLPSTSHGICLGNGLGIGTLTAANGALLNLSFSGDLCINDENTSTVTLFLSSNLAYLVEGGTGKFATETGTGNMSVSSIFVNPTGSPIPGTGEIAMTGTLSKN